MGKIIINGIVSIVKLCIVLYAVYYSIQSGLLEYAVHYAIVSGLVERVINMF